MHIYRSSETHTISLLTQLHSTNHIIILTLELSSLILSAGVSAALTIFDGSKRVGAARMIRLRVDSSFDGICFDVGIVKLEQY